MVDIEGGTVYDLMCQVMTSKTPMTDYEIRNNLSNIAAWFSTNMEDKYYFLLCRELNDYTMFNFTTLNYQKAREELKEVLDGRGPILQIDYNHDMCYFEIWVKYVGDLMPHMYILFPCNDFVIEI